MKSNNLSFLSLASVLALGTALLFSACSKTDKTDTSTTSSTAATDASTTAASTAAGVTAAMSDTWTNVKDYTYDQRNELKAKADMMATRLEAQTSVATGEASRKLADARDELRSASAEISNATAETWDSTKERIGRAWQKAESAVQGVAE